MSWLCTLVENSNERMEYLNQCVVSCLDVKLFAGSPVAVHHCALKRISLACHIRQQYRILHRMGALS